MAELHWPTLAAYWLLFPGTKMDLEHNQVDVES